MRHRCFGALGVWISTALALSAGCSDSEESGPPPPPDGYVRYEAPPVTVQPGESGMWLQWVSPPLDRDQNIADLVGIQGQGGHHVILYTTKESQPNGTTRVFENEDQSAIQFVGGAGGEGADSLKLPDGVVFRVPAGRSLLLQTHYLNTSDAPFEGTSYVDVKFSDPSPSDQVASFFANASRRIEVPPNQDSQRDTSCVLKKDLPVIMYANHMHEMGMKVTTTLTDTGGATRDIKSDPAWDKEWTFNPTYTIGDPKAPLMLTAGSTLTTHCEWRNTSGKTLTSPDEMCVFFAFFLGDKDVTCADGAWRE